MPNLFFTIMTIPCVNIYAHRHFKGKRIINQQLRESFAKLGKISIYGNQTLNADGHSCESILKNYG